MFLPAPADSIEGNAMSDENKGIKRPDIRAIAFRVREGHITREEAERELWAIGLTENAAKWCLAWAPLLIGHTDKLIDGEQSS
jgi:hypothetical protein